jgi:hypothetical protein
MLRVGSNVDFIFPCVAHSPRVRQDVAGSFGLIVFLKPLADGTQQPTPRGAHYDPYPADRQESAQI